MCVRFLDVDLLHHILHCRHSCKKQKSSRTSFTTPSSPSMLGSMEEAQKKEEPIYSEVEVVKQQLEAHKVSFTASSSNYCALVPYLFLSLG